jgi:multiple sugar transport system substrate-binding protein
MRTLGFIRGAFVAAALATATSALAQGFDWKSQSGQTVNLMFNNHPWSQAMREMVKDFQAKTGINARIEIFNEEQYRARLTTLMQGKSADVDVFMTLTSREGAIFNRAGWYADLAALMKDKAKTSPDYNYEDFGASIRAASTFGDKVVAVPINQEGPLFYWRRDVFEKCKIAEPKYLEDILPAAAAIRKCDGSMSPWTGRGIRSVTPYAMAGFIYNSGGSFTTADGKPGLSQPNSVKGLEIYATLMRDYAPPGALNQTFTQVVQLIGQGRVAMTHEASNEFANIMKFPGRADDLGLKVLPPGKESGVSKPVAIGWGVAISANSQRQQAAWLFLQWATSREVQAKLVTAGVAPPRASVFEGEDFNAWVKELPARKAWADALIELGKTGTGVYQTQTDEIPKAREIIGGAMQDIVQGKATPVEAAKAADAELAKLQ